MRLKAEPYFVQGNCVICGDTQMSRGTKNRKIRYSRFCRYHHELVKEWKATG